MSASRLQLQISQLRSAGRKIESVEELLARHRRRFRLARFEARLAEFAKALRMQQDRLENLRPERMLRRGYSITRDSAGRLVTTVIGICPGERLLTQLADGVIESVAQNKDTPHGS